jgi:Rrf2 family protein
MRISAKGRYALAAVILLAHKYNSGEYITVISISEKLGISKIYLEQVFSLLKRGKIVTSVKGSQGGYRLSQAPAKMTVLDVLSAVEMPLFEKSEETVKEKAPHIEAAMRSTVFDILDSSVKNSMAKITVENLVVEALKNKDDNTLMFYI